MKDVKKHKHKIHREHFCIEVLKTDTLLYSLLGR